jgi:nitrate/TMAO reductase-like tetraheme cytochrome c subunit
MVPLILILSALIIIVLAWRAGRMGGLRGDRSRSFAVLMMVALPALWVVGALAYADRATKTTSFCLKCHEMQPYGESVKSANESVPSTHYRNEWVDRETGCYVCHASPGLAGAAVARMKGLRDVFVHFVGEVPDPIELDAPYDATICLSCHDRDEAFLELPAHRALAEASRGGEVTCGGCHVVAHALAD